MRSVLVVLLLWMCWTSRVYRRSSSSLRTMMVAAAAEEQTCLLGDGQNSADGSCQSSQKGDDKEKEEQDCEDKHEKCSLWAEAGECENNPSYMKEKCSKSCDSCGWKDGKDDDKITESVPQVLEYSSETKGTISAEQIQHRLQDTQRHLDEMKAMLPELHDICINKHELCTVWAIMGECDVNEGYMKSSCAPACLSCEFLSVEYRCPIDPNAKNAWEKGDLNRMFHRLSTDPEIQAKHEPRVLSSPNTTDGPWVMTLENIVTPAEAEQLIKLGAKEGFERSTDVGKTKADGTSEALVSTGRTSTNAWCQNDCYNDADALRVIHRLSNLTQIDETNSEFLQLLRYEPGQFYHVHHDFIGMENDRQQGPRILTLYLYLNDVEAGGGTNFDRLNVTVMPKVGRALLWPSVLDYKPTRKDHRTTHQALPVEAGIKYGANAWFHLRDFKTPNRNHCQ